MAERRPDRLFFALVPSPGLALGLSAWAEAVNQECRGRIMRPETLHMTVAFLGEVSRERTGEFIAAADRLDEAAFAFDLDRVGWWPHNRIVWAAPPAPVVQLSGLATRLRSVLGDLMPPAGDRFVPHVTLLRKAQRPPAAIDRAPLHWHVASMALLASRLTPAGPAYTQLAGWTFAGGAGAVTR